MNSFMNRAVRKLFRKPGEGALQLVAQEIERVPDFQKTAELVQEISAASKEQDSGGERINKALQQLERVIQQNASAAEEMASTTEELSGQSDQLVSLLGFFRTRDEGDAPGVRPGGPKNRQTVPSPAHQVFQTQWPWDIDTKSQFRSSSQSGGEER